MKIKEHRQLRQLLLTAERGHYTPSNYLGFPLEDASERRCSE